MIKSLAHIKSLTLFLVGILLFSTQLSSQSIKAKTSAKDVFERQAFDVTYEISGSGGSFSPPDFKPFRVVAGPFQSSNISIVNGRRSESKSFTYRLQIDKTGKFTIPPAKLTTKNVTKQSNSIKINVLKSNKQNAMNGKNIFLEKELSDSVIYVGQQLVIDHYIYYGNLDVQGSALVGDFPRDRFIVDQIKGGNRINPTQMVYNGKMQNKAKVSSLALFPLRSGDITVPDVNFQVDIRDENSRQRRGFFSFNTFDRKVVSTPEFELEVRPLPANAPDVFTGNVGTLNARVQSENKQWVVGQEFFVSLTLTGNGINDQVSAPKWEQKGFEIFDPKLISEDRKVQGGEIIFTKQYHYLVIPQEEGLKKLQLTYSYFDPKTESYVTRTESLGTIKILSSGEELMDATDKKLKDINSSESTPFYTKLWFYGSLCLVGALLFIGFKKINKKEQKNEVTPEEAARIIAKRRLSSAKELLDNNDTGKYWETLENSLRIYLEEKLKIGTSKYSIAEITHQWTANKFDDTLLEEWKEMVNKINLARYAGQDIKNMENLYKEALDWIVKCEAKHPA